MITTTMKTMPTPWPPLVLEPTRTMDTMEMNTKMKITKAQLKQIIKEELEVTLTNEEAGEMFGEEVQAQLEEQELNEDDPAMLASMLDPETIEALKLIAQASMKMGKELLAPAALALIGAAGARRGMGYRDEDDIK